MRSNKDRDTEDRAHLVELVAGKREQLKRKMELKIKKVGSLLAEVSTKNQARFIILLISFWCDERPRIYYRGIRAPLH